MASRFAINRRLTYPEPFLAAVVLVLCSWSLVHYIRNGRRHSGVDDLALQLEMSSSVPSTAELFWDSGKGFNQRESVSVAVNVTDSAHPQSLTFLLPAANLRQFRLDPLTGSGVITISDVVVTFSGRIILRIPPQDILSSAQIASRLQHGGAVTFSTVAGAPDPSLVFRLPSRLLLKRVRLFSQIWFFVKAFVCLLLAEYCFLRWRLTLFAFLHSLSPEKKCLAFLCLFPLLAYLPAWLLSLSSNPMLFMVNLAVGSQGQFMPGGASVDPNSGFTTQALGMLSARDWLHGILPWWNPLSGVGMPLAAEMQSSSLFLPFVLLLRFFDGVLYFRLALQITAGISTYLLLRKLRVGHFAALLGASLYELNGTFAWISHAPIAPVPFLPLLLLGVERAFDFARRQSRRGWILIAVAVAWSLYAGFPETAYLDGLLALVWSLRLLFIAGHGFTLPFLRKISAGVLCGLLLASPLVVPFLEYQHLSAFAHLIGSGHMPAPGFTVHLFPYIFGPIGTFAGFDASHQLENVWGIVGGYLGVAALFLSVLALVAGKSNLGLRWLLALWILLFFGRTFGVPGFTFLFHLIPAMDLTQIHRYSDPSWELAAILLAAFALDDWQKAQTRNLSRLLLSLFLTFLVCAYAWRCGSGVAAGLLKSAPDYALWLYSSVAWSGVIVALSAVLLSLRSGPHRRALLGLVLLLDATALFTVPTISGLRKPEINFAPVRFLQQHLGFYRVYCLGPLAPNYSAYFGFASINHNAVPTPGEWTRYIDSSLDPGVDPSLFVGSLPQPGSSREKALRDHLSAFQSLGVKYVLSHRSANPFEPLVSAPGAPRPRLVYQDWYSRIFELPDPAPYFQALGSPCRLSFASREIVRASCPGPASLIRRELFYPGWQATVNGKSVLLTRTASIFQLVPLPAGESVVTFLYRPSYSYWTLFAALLACLCILWSLALRLDSRRRRDLSSPLVPQTKFG